VLCDDALKVIKQQDGESLAFMDEQAFSLAIPGEYLYAS
jgi:hypothetical protein